MLIFGLIVLLIYFCLNSSQNSWPVLYYYSRSASNGYTINTIIPESLNFTITRRTYFIVHGFESSANVSWAIKIKDALLIHDDVNVFMVDWSKGAKTPYLKAASNVETSGNRISKFIVETGIPAIGTHCIGHSLGAHVCGFLGKKIKLARITGLDPAGPDFRIRPSSKRLSITDANYVDVIHGSIALGLVEPKGHKDFYPNGGIHQPGCPPTTDVITNLNDLDNIVSCSHRRIPYLFAESIHSTCKFMSVKCDNYFDYINGNCNRSKQNSHALMGFHSDSTNETGKFFLNTNSKEPYCKN